MAKRSCRVRKHRVPLCRRRHSWKDVALALATLAAVAICCAATYRVAEVRMATLQEELADRIDRKDTSLFPKKKKTFVLPKSIVASFQKYCHGLTCKMATQVKTT